MSAHAEGVMRGVFAGTGAIPSTIINKRIRAAEQDNNPLNVFKVLKQDEDYIMNGKYYVQLRTLLKTRRG
eukprot:947659-Prorocentrum_lima.AAC.1